MLTLRLSALAMLSAAVTLGSAHAADLPPVMPVKAPVMVPVVYNWTGFYAGVNAGYSWGRDPIDISASARTRVFRAFGSPAETLISDVTTPLGSSSGTADVNGFLGGVQIGYNWQSGAFVFGLETDIQWTGQKGGVQFCTPAGCGLGAATAIVDHKLDWFGTFRARAGMLIDPRVLLYVTGGLAYGQVTTDFSAGTIGLPLATASAKDTRVGWTIGAGIEGALSNNWTVKAEYLYMDLGTAPGVGLASTVILPDVPLGGFTTVIDSSVAASGRVRDNIFRLGLNYRFAPDVVVARY